LPRSLATSASVLEGEEQDLVRASGLEIEIVPADRPLLHFLRDLDAERGVLQPRLPLAVAAFAHPGWHGGIEAGGAGGIGVHVGGDARAGRARRLDPVDHRLQLVPIAGAGLFHMVDFGRPAGRLGDGDEFVCRLQHVVALVAHMADVHAAAPGRGGGKRDQLGRFGEGGGRVDERAAKAHGAFIHRLADEVLHLAQLAGIGIDVVLAKYKSADRGRADEAGDIGGDALFLEEIPIAAERPPGDRMLDIDLLRQSVSDHLVIVRAFGIALAHDFQRDALADIAFARAILDQGVIGPAQHVDEAGGDGEALGIDDLGRSAVDMRRDRHDLVVPDRDIANVRIITAAVDDRPATNDGVVTRRRRCCRCGEQESERK